MLKRSRLQTSDFRIGWICALQVEVDAARAVLDEEYEDIHEAATYILGRISRHDVVIACPPAGETGIGAAAVTAERLRASFSAIKYWLMVGIGGGVPGASDVRLGDVVISQPSGEYGGVVQYDKGKTGPGGQRLRTGSLNAPPQELLAAVTKLRSNITIGRTSLNACIDSMGSNAYFARPNKSSDTLFKATYNHTGGSTCDNCALESVVARPPRQDNKVTIHYGLIASGNQVIKDGITRDLLSNEFGGVLCFEMEAAGLMNSISCLVIRGICDYADSHKNKKWQPFAAATAAACAKEVLSCVPNLNRSDSERDVGANYSVLAQRGLSSRKSTIDDHLGALSGVLPSGRRSELQMADSLRLTDSMISEEDRTRLFESLRFEQLESRYLSIKSPHSKTCRWMIQRAEMTDWLDNKKLREHHGFLWIKGKAATGKSIAMKFLLSHMKATEAATILAAFFFNARGEWIERSTLGMYQSILYQVLEQCPDLKHVFDVRLGTSSANGDFVWTVEKLKVLLRLTLSRLGSRSLICVIDALDECNDDNMQDMVSFFEEIGSSAITSGLQVRVLFSSRHYPYITVDRGITLILEAQDEHNNDIVEYLRTELKAGDSQKTKHIKENILTRASGIFLWVVLVVDILNHEYRRGRIHALERRLKEIPDDIERLFHDILNRGGACSEETTFCLQWVLYAKRPLKLEELYFGILSGTDPDSITEWDEAEITTKDMERFILDVSKGLVEHTKTKTKTVQFIHESVREFFLSGNGLNAEPFAPFGTFPARSHEALKVCCSNYCEKARQMLNSRLYPDHRSWLEIARLDSKQYFAARNAARIILRTFPFIDYACENVFVHSDVAGCLNIAQELPLDEICSSWSYLSLFLKENGPSRLDNHFSIIYHLADKNLLHLMDLILTTKGAFLNLSERPWWLVLTGLVIDNERNMAVVQSWLTTTPKTPSDFPVGISVTNSTTRTVAIFLREHGRSIAKRTQESILLWACRYGLSELVQMLLVYDGIDKLARTSQDEDAIMLAINHKQTRVLRLLTQSPVFDTHEPDVKWLQSAIMSNSHENLRLIFDKYNFTERSITIANLYACITAGVSSDVIKMLLGKTIVDWTSQDVQGPSVLEAIMCNAQPDVKRSLFLQYRDEAKLPWGTLFPMVAASGSESVVAFALGHPDADVNWRDNCGKTVLHHAVQNSQKREISKMLLRRMDTIVNIFDNEGMSPLLYAIVAGDLEIIQLLLRRNDTDVNTPSARQMTLWFRGDFSIQRTPIRTAVDIGDLGVINALLARDDLKIDKNDFILLHLPASRGDLKVLECLLEDSRINVHAVDSEGRTAYDAADEHRKFAAARLLYGHMHRNDADGG